MDFRYWLARTPYIRPREQRRGIPRRSTVLHDVDLRRELRMDARAWVVENRAIDSVEPL
jgi:hypothetical protein